MNSDFKTIYYSLLLDQQEPSAVFLNYTSEIWSVDVWPRRLHNNIDFISSIFILLINYEPVGITGNSKILKPSKAINYDICHVVSSTSPLFLKKHYATKW